MPARFSLLSTRIVEPDKLTGAPGHIYLWVEEVDDRQIVIGPPRAFEVPYVVEIATDVATAQSQARGRRQGARRVRRHRQLPSQPATVQKMGDGTTNNRQGQSGSRKAMAEKAPKPSAIRER